MAKISLREYIQKIESLIDRGETDQAIFHSKTILKSYPKHIDSYRLLGKALLEKKKFGDAADIFQRVLSSVSDDFISQIGMSIIREDENNLDEAIWHMERAFETQPSNKTVQEELMKLYSLRDGVTPAKIRLTRGALVRMYVKGELYSQAIAEIQAALSEDPNRVDLEVILAQLYNSTGQKIEAMEICSKLISKLPYCYEANLILTELLPGTGRSEDEKIFRQRLIELDPYFEFIESANSSSIDVPDNKVMLDYIEYDGTQFDQIQSDWAESLGLDINEEVTSEDELPDDWFNFEQPEEENPVVSETIESEVSNDNNDETIISDTTRTDLSELLKSDEEDEPLIPDFDETKEDSTLPDWIKDAGWSQAEDDNIESQKGFNIIEDNERDPIKEIDGTEEVEIEPGEIPEWLKEIAPTEKIEDLSNIDGEESDYEDDQEFENLFDHLAEQEEGGQKDNLDPSLEWLREFQTEGNFEDSPFKGDMTLEELSLSNSEIDSDKENSEGTIEQEDFEGENIEELEEVENAESDHPEEPELISEVINVVEQPDQIDIDLESSSEISEEAESLEKEPGLVSVDTNEVEKSDQIESGLESSSEISEEAEYLEKEPGLVSVDMNEVEQSDQIESDLETTQLISEEAESLEKEPESDMSWLEAISEKEILNQNKENEISDENMEIPDWMKAIDEEESNIEPQVEETIQSVISGEDKASEESFDLPDWLQLNDESEIEETGEEIGKISSELHIPELEELEEPDEVVEEIEKSMEEISQDDFVDEEKLEESEEELPVGITDSEESVFVEDSEVEQDDIDSALTWMESLAVKHGASEDTLISKPEERDENPPEWIKALSSLSQEDDEQVINEPEENQVFETSQENLTPDWLQALQIETNVDDSTELESEKITSDFIDENETDTIDVKPVDSKEVDEEIEELLRETGQLQHHFEAETEDLESQFIDQGAEEAQVQNEMDFEEEVEINEELDETKEFEKALSSVEEETDETQEYEKLSSSVDEISISKSSQERLDFAKQLITKGKIDEALEVYNEFIHAELVLDKVIIDLQDALNNQYPININLWQALGDAQLRNNQLQEALDSYTKAEELLS